MPRPDGRKPSELRPVQITRGYTRHAPGSVLIRTGDTVLLCTACWESGVPPWREGSGEGWVTAEYDMLPGSTTRRRPRNRQKIDGRTQEIQRLIGRSLRAIVDFARLKGNTVLIDCDVLQADGGTRTAAVTGAYVALCDATRAALKNRSISANPIREAVAAVSVGIVKGRPALDLCYQEDVEAQVDMNVVMTESGRFVEVQGTGEHTTFTQAELDSMLRLAARGTRQLIAVQKKVLRRRLPKG